MQPCMVDACVGVSLEVGGDPVKTRDVGGEPVMVNDVGVVETERQKCL